MGGNKLEGEVRQVEYRGAHSQVEEKILIPMLKCAALALGLAIVFMAVAASFRAWDWMPVALLLGLVIGAVFLAAYFGKDLGRDILGRVEVATGVDIDRNGQLGTGGGKKPYTAQQIDELAREMVKQAHRGESMSFRTWKRKLKVSQGLWEDARKKLLARNVCMRDAHGELVLRFGTSKESIARLEGQPSAHSYDVAWDGSLIPKEEE